MRNPMFCPVSPGGGAARKGKSPDRHQPARAFTIVEVMMAAIVLVLGITTSITALQYGLRAVDTARNMTLASQIMQSEIEIIRMQNWSQIIEGTSTVDPATTISSGTGTALDATLTAMANRFVCTQKIEAISGRADFKRITLSVTWNGVDGRAHELVYQTRYAKNGLSDYFYVSH